MTKTIYATIMISLLTFGAGLVYVGLTNLDDLLDKEVNIAEIYRIVEIEEHEYIFIEKKLSTGVAITHSANCKNEEHNE